MPKLLVIDRPRDGVTRLTLNRPEKKNALSIALRDHVTDALAALAADETVKAVVVTGAGDTFSAGFDLREFEDPGSPTSCGRPATGSTSPCCGSRCRSSLRSTARRLRVASTSR